MANLTLNNMTDYSNKDYESLRAAMLDIARERLPEWTDHSANDMGVVLLELFAQMSDVMLYSQDRMGAESYLNTATERRSIVNLLRLIGYELRPHRPASADLTLLFNIDAVGIITLQKGTEFQTSAASTGEPINFQYLRDPLEINVTTLPVYQDQEGESYYRLERLPVTQVDATITNEIIGSSNGAAGQRFQLKQAPIIDDELIITINESDTLENWQRQDNLLASLAEAKHYIVRRDDDVTVYVEFGDGRHGKIPARGRNNITASYRVGGGIKGNVAALTISKAVTGISNLEQVFNLAPATGGADAESSETAVQRGPNLFRSMRRAVTTNDYEAHALEYGVAKARARATAWNHIEIFVAPIGGGQPTDTLKEDLRKYYEDKRMMSTIIDILDPVYVNVCIAGTLEIDAYHFTEQIQQKVSNAVAGLLAFEAVDFQFRFHLSKIYEAIENIEGVNAVHVTRLALENTGTLPENGFIQFDWDQIPVSLHMNWTQNVVDNTWTWEIQC